MGMSSIPVPQNAEFRFNCTTCGQHILAATGWHGLEIECPSCHSRITVPESPREEPRQNPETPPRQTGQTIRIELPLRIAGDSSTVNRQMPEVPNFKRVSEADPRTPGTEPWPDFVRQLESGALIGPADLATALFQELTSVRRRLDEVEKKLAQYEKIRPKRPLRDSDAFSESKRREEILMNSGGS